MTRSSVHHCFFLGIVVVLLVGAALPAQAEYTKYYKFANATGVPQSLAQATTFGMEYIAASSSTPWGPGVPGYTVFCGVWSSTITCGGVPVGEEEVEMGWTTWDMSCYLWDMRWGNGEPVINLEQLGGIPGGGGAVYDPVTMTVTWEISNDQVVLDPNNPPVIQLDSVQATTYAGESLGYDELSEVAEEGAAGKRALDTILDITELSIQVAEALGAGDIRRDVARGLQGKLDGAANQTEVGLKFFEAGRVDKAYSMWAKAIRHMDGFVDHVQAHEKKGKIPEGLADSWIEIATGIIAELAALGETEDLSTTGVAPPVLAPGESFTITVENVLPGDALVASGTVLDDAGTPVLFWTEQLVIESDTAAPMVDPPVITAASYPAVASVTLTASDEGTGGSGVAGIFAAVDPVDVIDVVDGEPVLNVTFHPNGTCVLDFDQPGVYKIHYRAVDRAGNCSDPQVFSFALGGPWYVPDDPDIGTWDEGTRTYTLTTDLVLRGSGSPGIELTENDMTLDGAGHSIRPLADQPHYGVRVPTSGCTVQGLVIAGVKHGIELTSPAQYNIIAGNSVSDSGVGITLNGSDWNTVAANSLVDNWAGVQLFGALDTDHVHMNAVTDNVVSGAYWGIFLHAATHSEVAGNTVSGSVIGIYLFQVSDCDVTGNTVSQCTDGIFMLNDGPQGVYNEWCRRNTLAGNNASDCTDRAMSLWWHCMENHVVGNTCTGSGRGIYLYGGSYSNEVLDNVFSGNVQGMVLGFYANGTLVTGNTISSNTSGMSIWESEGCQIYLNDFIDNVEYQAWDGGYGEKSQFNLDLPVGGNYWSDWTGPDTDGDGIVDLPYLFEGNADELPHTTPTQ